MHAYVYKSLKKADTYAYLARRDDFDCLPAPVRKQLGELRFVLDVALVEGRSQLLQYDSLRDRAPDDYLLLREFWLQHRQYEILDQSGEETVAALPDYLQQETAQTPLSESSVETRVDAK